MNQYWRCRNCGKWNKAEDDYCEECDYHKDCDFREWVKRYKRFDEIII